MWLFGLFFVSIGGLFVLGPLGLFTNAQQLELWERAVALMIGALGVVTGVWTIVGAPRTTVTCDRLRSEVRITRRGLRGGEQRIVPFSDLAAVFVSIDADSEGDEICQPRLRLHSGAEIPLSRLWVHDRAVCEARVQTISAYLLDAGVLVVCSVSASPDFQPHTG